MSNALIGYTGFVGGNLLRQGAFEALFNTANIHTIRGREFDLLVSAGAPAAKWIANREPEQDRAGLEQLMDHLSTVRSHRAILISTIDVYDTPVGVDEDSEPRGGGGSPYGRHRLRLEEFFGEHFNDLLIVRLPALFGEGLKKNIVYDFLHGNQLSAINPQSIFQFYSLDDLWADIGVAQQAGVRLINFATEPLSVAQVACEAFGFEFTNPAPPGPPARYDFRSRHAALYGGRCGYLRNQGQVLSAMRAFVLRSGWQGQ